MKKSFVVSAIFGLFLIQGAAHADPYQPSNWLHCHGPLLNVKSRTISQAFFKRKNGSQWIGRGLVTGTFWNLWKSTWTPITNFESVETGTVEAGMTITLTPTSKAFITKLTSVGDPNPMPNDATIMDASSTGKYATDGMICTYETDFQYYLDWPTPEMNGTAELQELIND